MDFEDKVEELIKHYFNEMYDRLINVFAKTEVDPEFGPAWSKLATDFRFKSKDTDAFVQDKGLASEDVEPPLKQVVVDIDYTSSSPELNARKRLERSFDAVSGEEHPTPESIKLKGGEVPVQSSTSKKGPYPSEVNGDAPEDVVRHIIFFEAPAIALRPFEVCMFLLIYVIYCNDAVMFPAWPTKKTESSTIGSYWKRAVGWRRS